PGTLAGSASLTVEGEATDDEGSPASAEISTDGRSTWSPLEVAAGGHFAHTIELPLVDSQAMAIHVRARDGSGLVGTAETSITVDRVNPSCALVAPVAGQRFARAQGPSFQVKATAADGAGLSALELSVDDGASFKEVALSGGEATLDWQLPSLDGASRKVIARAKDASGNSCEASATVEIDNVQPVLAFLTPAADGVLGLSDGPAFTVRVSASDGSDAPTAEVSTDDGATFTEVTLTSGEGSLPWTLPPQLDGATVKLKARATDAFGNVTLVERQVVVDQVAPVCAFASPAPGQVLNKAGGQSFDVRWSVTDGSGRVSPSSLVTLNGVQASVTEVAGAWSTPWALSTSDDGADRTLTAQGSDLAGNACPVASVTVRVDLVAPVLTITSPAANAVLGPAAVTQATFQGQASDGSGPVTVKLDFDDGAGARPAAVTAVAWSVAVPLALQDYVAHNVVVSATDSAGNPAQVTRTVRVDRVAPALTVTAPAPAQKFNIATVLASGAVRAAWTVTDGDPARVTEAGAGTALQVVTGTGVDLPTSASDNPATYTVTVRVRDTAGNPAEATRTFFVDRVRPAITASTPADGSRAVAPSARYSPSVTFSEPVTAVAQSVALALSPASSGAAGTWSGNTWTVGGLDYASPYVAEVKSGAVQDSFGNTNSEKRTWRFANPVRLPPAGVLRGVGTVTDFSAAADEDGAFWFAAERVAPPNCPPPPQLCIDLGQRNSMLFEVSPVTGAIVTHTARIGVFNDPSRRHRLSASRSVDALLGAHRRAALNVSTVSGGLVNIRSASWLESGSPGLQQDAAAKVAIPAERHVQESPASGDMGFVYSAGERYVRSGNADVNLGFAPTAAFAGPVSTTFFTETFRSWVLAEERADGSVGTSKLGCSLTGVCAFTPAQPGPSAVWTGNAANPRLSVAVSTAAVAMVMDRADGINRTFFCDAPCSGMCLLPVEPAPVAQGLRVAPAFSGAQILGARLVGGNLELLRRDLTNRCAAPWTVLKSIPANPTHWEPLMLGTQPALLYVEAGVVYLNY
ncbi:MAG: Ig-like domain-containing protein, partial [Myxococcaceae bacterium]